MPLLAGIRAAVPDADLLVIDDNSSDGTADLARQFGEQDERTEVVVRTQDRGLGTATRDAMKSAVAGSYDYFLNLDGDLSHDPEHLPRLLDRAMQTPTVGVVIGSRYTAGGEIIGWPLHRRWMSRVVNHFATRCLRLPVRDCSGSMRCYHVADLVRIDVSNLRARGYAVLEEVLVLLHGEGVKMAEVPITFTDRQQGRSKLTLREAVRSMFQIVRLALRK